MIVVGEPTHHVPSFGLLTSSSYPSSSYSFIGEGLSTKPCSKFLPWRINTSQIYVRIRASSESLHSAIYRRARATPITRSSDVDITNTRSFLDVVTAMRIVTFSSSCSVIISPPFTPLISTLTIAFSPWGTRTSRIIRRCITTRSRSLVRWASLVWWIVCLLFRISPCLDQVSVMFYSFILSFLFLYVL